MILERLETARWQPGQTVNFRPEQIAHRSTWTAVPDAQTAVASMTRIHTIPFNTSTETFLNPMDPADALHYEVDYSETSGKVCAAGRPL